MKTEKLFSLIIGLKLLLLILGISILWIQKLQGQPVWFNPVESDASIRQAIKAQEAPLNSYNKDGYTGLMKMVIDGRYDMVQLFVEAKTNLNLKAKTDSIQKGDTALRLAVSFGSKINQPYIIRYLIDRKADVSIPNALGEQAIHVLRNIDDYDERLAVLNQLMEHGADINAQTNQGNTMLHLTVEHRDKKWIRVLRDTFGSQLNMDIRNNEGLTPLALAKKRNYVGDDSVVYYLEEYQPVLGEGYGGYRDRNELDQTPLMVAIIRNDISFAQTMIQRGVPINATDNFGKTALFYAVESKEPVKFVTMLITENVHVKIADKQGKTALHLVPDMKQKGKQIKVAKLLIKAGANINARDKSGNTIWHIMAKKGATALIRSLKKAFGRLLQNKSGKTALDVARDHQKKVKASKKSTKKEKQKAARLSSSLGG